MEVPSRTLEKVKLIIMKTPLVLMLRAASLNLVHNYRPPPLLSVLFQLHYHNLPQRGTNKLCSRDSVLLLAQIKAADKGCTSLLQ